MMRIDSLWPVQGTGGRVRPPPHPSLFLHLVSKIPLLHSHTMVTVFGYVALAYACVATSETRIV